MRRDPDEVNRIANLLALKIQNRRPDIAKHIGYVKGERGELKFVSDEFKRYISGRFKGFTDNWCLPVAQAPIERIQFKGFTPYSASDKIPSSVYACWQRSDCDRYLSEAALVMTAARRSFGLVTLLPNGKARISFENPDSAAMLYDAITGEPTAGLLLRQDSDNEYGQLLFPDMVIDIQRKRDIPDNRDNGIPPSLQGWEFVEGSEQNNPLGEIPLVEFRNQTLLDNAPLTDIGMVEDMQDAVNVVWAYLLNGLDWATLPGRLILGGDELVEPVYDSNGTQIGEKPVELDKQVNERILQITGDNVKAAEWSSANITAFLPVIQKAVEHIAAETRTPGHYLLTSAEVPATGYEVAEAGLVSKTTDRIGYLKGGIRKLARLASIMEGDDATANILESSTVSFASPLYRNEAQQADAMTKYQKLGYPLQWIAERMGLSPAEIERVMAMKRDEETDPELMELNRSLRIGADDGHESGEPDGKPETTGDAQPDGATGGAENMATGRSQ
jgi:hypothetical protein